MEGFQPIPGARHRAVSRPRLQYSFDARVNDRDLRETYLPHYEACVKEADAYSIMRAYNHTNNEACTNQLYVYDEERLAAVHPGRVDVMVGRSSDSLPLTGSFEIVSPTTGVQNNKVFFSKAHVR